MCLAQMVSGANPTEQGLKQKEREAAAICLGVRSQELIQQNKD